MQPSSTGLRKRRDPVLRRTMRKTGDKRDDRGRVAQSARVQTPVPTASVDTDLPSFNPAASLRIEPYCLIMPS